MKQCLIQRALPPPPKKKKKKKKEGGGGGGRKSPESLSSEFETLIRKFINPLTRSLIFCLKLYSYDVLLIARHCVFLFFFGKAGLGHYCSRRIVPLNSNPSFVSILCIDIMHRQNQSNFSTFKHITHLRQYRLNKEYQHREQPQKQPWLLCLR